MTAFLAAVAKAGPFDIQWEPSVESLLAKTKSRVDVVVLEHSSDFKSIVSALRSSGRKFVIVLVAQALTKEEALFAIEQRIHSLLEKPDPLSPHTLEQFRKAIEQSENAAHSEALFFSLKSALLGLSGDTVGESAEEIRKGLSKVEKTLQINEFLGGSIGSAGETKLPFYKSQSFADALLTIEDLGRTGTLQIKSGPLLGKVEFLQGRPTSATAGEARAVKALFRIFLWESPEFTFRHQEAAAIRVRDAFEFSTSQMCREGETLCARFETIRSQIPPLSVRLQLDPEALNTQTKLDKDEFSTLASVVELSKVAEVIDYNPLHDVILYECLIGLRRSGVIRVTAA
jgi:hypothetical protein